MTKKKISIIIFIFSLILLLFSKWLVWDIIYNKNMLIRGIILLIADITCILVSIGSLFWMLYMHKSRLLNIVSIFLLVFCMIWTFILANSYINIKLDFMINKHNREKIVDMINSSKIEQYRMGEFLYKVPIRTASQTNTISYYKNNDQDVVVFFVNSGEFGGSAVIYASSDKDISKTDIGLNYKKVGKLEKNWYYVLFR